MIRSFSKNEFQEVAKKGKAGIGRYIILNSLRSEGYTKLGITVTKRFGKAHVRNRFKRLVREAFRKLALPSHFLLIHVRPKMGAGPLVLHELQKEMHSLISKQCLPLDGCSLKSGQSLPSFLEGPLDRPLQHAVEPSSTH